MKPETKYKLITFLKYIILEPWTDKFTLPNLTTLSWIFIIFSLIIRDVFFLWISIIFGIVVYGLKEYKSGKHVGWYRERKLKEFREIRKKLKNERKNKLVPIEIE